MKRSFLGFLAAVAMCGMADATPRKPLVLNNGQTQQIQAGDTLATPAPATDGSVILTPGTTPSAPSNGALWTTTTGLYAEINGLTVGPFSTGAGTVTSVTCNGGLTGGTFTTSGTCSLNSPTAHAVLLGEGSSPAGNTGAGASAQVLLGQGSSADPAWETLSGGATVGASGVVTLGNPGALTLGGVESFSASAHNFLTGINTSGVPQQAQPAFTDISGTLGVPAGGTGQTTYTDGQLLIGDSSTNLLDKATITAGTGISVTNGHGSISIAATGGSGSVTSVGLSLPGIITVSGSPVTTSGTLTGTLATQSANLVWAGPTTGAAAAPTFRALVGADLPAPSATTLGGIESYASVSHQWINTISTSGVPSSTQPACGDLSNAGTACQAATGTSGATVPLLNGANTWSGVQSINSGDLALKGATSGTITLNAAATAGTSTITLPGGTTDFSASGGASQVVKQVSTGAAFTVGQLANTDITGLGTASTANTGTSGATLGFLNGANAISGVQTYTNSDFKLLGSSTGANTFTAANASSTNYTTTIPANTGTLSETNLAESFTAAKTFTNSDLLLLGSSTGATTFTSANASSTAYTVTVPANTGTLAETNLAQTYSAQQSFGANDVFIVGTSTGGVALASAATGSTSYVDTFPNASGTVALLGITAQTFTSNNTFQANAAASTPGVGVTGAVYTGGSSTTAYGLLYVGNGAATGFNAAGSMIAVNAPSGFTAHLQDWQVNGAGSVAFLDYQGDFTFAGSLGAASNGALLLLGAAQDVGLNRQAASTFGIGASGSTSGTGGSLKLTGLTAAGAIINTGITADTGKTDSSVCQDTTLHQFYSGTGTVGICLGTSSARYKHGIAPLDVGLSELMRLKPVSYYLNSDHGDPTKLYYGFIAEQGVKALPKLVGKDESGAPNTMDYLGVVPVLVRAMQQQQAEIRALKAQVAAMHSHPSASPRSSRHHPSDPAHH